MADRPLVEVTGASSAGKTTFISKLLADHPDEFVGREAAMAAVFRVDAIPTLALRTLVEDLAALAGLVSAPRDFRAVAGAVRAAASTMPDVSGRERFNRIRNAYRHIGMFLFLRKWHTDDRTVLLDTGPVHTAHNLFIHLGARPDADAVAAYIGSVPMADVVLLVTEHRDTIIERTLARGHRRISTGNVAEATVFTEHALEAFELATHHEAVAGRLGTVRPSSGTTELSHVPDRIRTLVTETVDADRPDVDD